MRTAPGSLQRATRTAVTVVLACALAWPFSAPQTAGASPSVTIQLDAAHTVVVSASAGLRTVDRREIASFAGVSDVIYRYNLVANMRQVGTLEITVRTLPAGNVAVFSRLNAPKDRVTVDLEVRTRAESHTFRGLDPAVHPTPGYDTHTGYDRTTNPIGVVEIYNERARTSALFLGKSYEFRELTQKYSGGRVSRVKELIREESAYSLGRSSRSASVKLLLSGNSSSCERYFVVSPRPILDGALGGTDLKRLAQMRLTWVDRTGPYMKGPWSVDPSTQEGYVRSLQQLRAQSVIRDATSTRSEFMSDLAYSNLYSLWLLRGADGLWRTEWTSTWVRSSTGIVAPYVDTRHNELIALWMLEFASAMKVPSKLASSLRSMALPYADYLAEKASSGQVIKTKTGYFFHDYYNEHGGSRSFVSLNHALGEQNFLLRMYLETGDNRYRNAGLAIRNAIRDTTPGWIAPSGDLWYSMTPKGVFAETDYPTLTLNDLVWGQQMLETVTGSREAAYDTLIRSKTAFRNGGSIAVAGLPGDEPESEAAREGWWAAPEPDHGGEIDSPGADAGVSATEITPGTSEMVPLSLPVLGSSPVDGTLKSSSSTMLYSVTAPEGRILRVRLVGTPASDFDLRLYAPGGGPEVTKAVASKASILYPDVLTYTVPSGGGGDFVLEVHAKWGKGDFVISREILTPTHSTLADALPAGSPLTGTVDPAYNRRDTYAIDLSPGDHVVATLKTPAANRVGVRLLAPDASSATASEALGSSFPDRLSYTVPPGQGGTYYFDVHCLKGSGAYRVEYEVRKLKAAERFPGVDFSGTPAVGGTVDWASRPVEVRGIEAEAGETIRLRVRRASAAVPIDGYLYAPGTTETSARVLASARGWGRNVDLSYTVPPGGDGRYLALVHASAGSGTYQLSAVREVSVAGADRYDTAVAASQRAYPDGLAPDGKRTVIIATGTNWPDALGGTSLAGVVDGPVLLVKPTSVPGAVMTEIVRLGATEAIVLGGTAAVGDKVVSALKSKLTGDVRRIHGANRYLTADKIAREVISARGSAYDGGALVATGEDFPDALAAAPLAASKGWPLYLAHPESGLSAGSEAAMAGVRDVVILGGTGVVSADTADYVGKRPGVSSVTRLQGGDRYQTAAAIAKYAVSKQGHSWNRVGITTGRDFPDALAGGVVQGRAGSVMLLTPRAALNADTAAALSANTARIDTITIFGGPAVLGESVRAAAGDALR